MPLKTLDNQQLSCLPVPFEDESPFSVIQRAASANGWSSAATLLKTVLNLQCADQAAFSLVFGSSRNYKKACNILGMSEAIEKRYRTRNALVGSDIQWMGLFVPRAHIRLYESAVCPLCLEEDIEPYERRYWDHKFVATCEIHSVELATKCTNCGEKLTRSRAEIATCNCGYDLRSMRTADCAAHNSKVVASALNNMSPCKLNAGVALSMDIEAIARLLHKPGISPKCIASEWMCHPARIANDLQHLSVSSTSGVATHLRVVLRNLLTLEVGSGVADALLMQLQAGNLRQIAVEALDPDESVFRSDMEKILGATPSITQAILADGLVDPVGVEGIRTPKYLVSDLNSFLIRLEHRLAKRTTDTFLAKPATMRCRDYMKKAMTGEFCCLEYALPVGLSGLRYDISRSDSERQDNDLLGVKEFAVQMHCHAENIRFLIRSGFVTPVSKTGTKYLFEKSFVEEFSRNYAFGGALARSIGIAPNRFSEQLIHAGAIPVSGPTIDNGLTFLFDRHSTSNLDLESVAQIQGYKTRSGRRKNSGPPPRKLPSGAVSIVEAARLLNRPVQAVTRLLERSELTRVPTMNRSIAICRRSLDALLAIHSDQEWGSLAEAAKNLGLTTHQFTRRWVVPGLVATRTSLGQRQHKKTDLDKVLSSNRKVVNSIDASVNLGIHRTYFRNLEKIGKIRPLRRPSDARFSVNLISPDQLEAAAAHLDGSISTKSISKGAST